MVTRVIIRGVGDDGLWSLNSNAWSLHLRNMHKDRTSHIFDMLGVDDLDDTLAMQVTVRELAKRVWSSRVAAQYSSLSLVDLPCQACEYGGVLTAVQAIRIGGEHVAIEWLLKHLPGGIDVLKGMGCSIKVATSHLEGKGDGLDRQAAGCVTRAWLKQNHASPRLSMWSACIRSREDIFQLHTVYCPECSGFMQDTRRGPKRHMCEDCVQAKRRHFDKERQAKRRRLL